MESAATTRSSTGLWPTFRSLDTSAASAWVLTGALLLYLGFDGGGYSLASHSQVGILVWWVVVVCATWGILPVAGLTRSAWIAVTIFAGFVAWTALATTWSISSGRSLEDLSLVACYLGIFVLGVSIHRDRARGVQHTVYAVAAAVTVVAAAAVASRLWPHLFAGTHQTYQFLPGARDRLAWPLNYWNALAALVDLGVPLLLSVATSARTLRAQAAAAAALPVVVLCAALTLSRGGVIAGTIGVVVFLLFAPNRIPKLATTLTAAAGSALVVAGAFERHALQQAIVSRAASHEATALVGELLLVCAGVALVQLGIGLADRHGTLPRVLTIERRAARRLLVGFLAVGIVVAAFAGVPGHIAHVWDQFKIDSPTGGSISRFGATSGDGRYQYWTVAVHSTTGHTLGGSGPGTFQLLWLPHAPFLSYVINAHSLYVETFAEEGVVGLLLLVGFLLFVLLCAIRLVVRSRFEERTLAAALSGALVAFLISAAFDWVWQVPVLPAAFLLLGAAALTPRFPSRPLRLPSRSLSRVRTGPRALGARAGAIVVGIASILAIVYPLATGTAVAESQSAAAAGNLAAALSDANEAVRIEPGAAAAHLQVALVLELEHDYPAAALAARGAVLDEPANWSNWLTLSRLEAESGHAKAAVADYLEAKRLNPKSSLFHQ